ncbi:D-alanyl-D-alanine carboxypeptidase family protein [Croceitalea dokdonensis DOKDO 023]|uniref:D-alanyl-D-alanine carboxypeptidase family protein n=1 Tax=Croceitalea dokdonensis DOKDO 023 TaxID=1300341 RepID=A0A0P7ARC4_9FLAO|nr:M15 family metallopeptidase [Croceitalea dokdonensis]KPM30291.1 D-alanyl-D-alanine carboxypeptidase family protein [Croceitalea dokdonensis DOKDO 023]
MQRRTFIKQAGLGSVALTTAPVATFSNNDTEYSIVELMGKSSIQLYGEGINLRKEAHDAFVAMKKAAYSAGFDIKMISSYRDFYRQESIWERKYISYTEEDGMKPIDAISKIVEYSTIPGTSRHHWGTDIDIIDGYPKVSGDVLVPSKFAEDGPFGPFKKWLDDNSEKFGFYLVYTDNYFRKGFKYEPWHFSYAPLSKPMLKQFRSKNIFKMIKNESFEGSDHFTTGFLKNYIHNNILDINPDLL